MHDIEKLLPFAARVRQLAATFKTPSVSIDDRETAIDFLNRPPLCIE